MPKSNLESLHAAFCSLSGRPLTFSLAQRRWFEFAQAGFTEADVRLVVEWLIRENRKHPNWQYSMTFSKVIGDLEKFDEYRAEALAVKRNARPPITPRQQVLEQFHPIVDEQMPAPTVIPIKDALKRAVDKL